MSSFCVCSSVVFLVAVVVALIFSSHTLPTVDIASVSFSETNLQISELENTGKNFNSESLIKLGENLLIGPESFVEDPNNPKTYFAGTADGKIIKIENENVSLFSYTGGRPLGIHVLKHNTKNLEEFKVIVAEALIGLLGIRENGSIEILSNFVNNKPIRYANDLDFDEENSIIYFTDCSEIPPIFDKTLRKWSTMKAALFDIISGYPSGRLIKYDIKTKQSTELLSDIAYANGVALSNDKSFVLVAETARYCVRKYWLTGSKG